MNTSACIQFGRRFKEMNDQLSGLDEAYGKMIASGDFAALDVFTPAFSQQAELIRAYKEEAKKVVEQWKSSLKGHSDVKGEVEIDDYGKVSINGNVFLNNERPAPMADHIARQGYFPQIIRQVRGSMWVHGLQVDLNHLEEVTDNLELKDEDVATYSLNGLRKAHGLDISYSGITNLPALEEVTGNFTPPTTLTEWPTKLRAVGGTLSLTRGSGLQSIDGLEEVGDTLSFNDKLTSAKNLRSTGSILYDGIPDVEDFRAIFPALKTVGDHLGVSFTIDPRHTKLLASINRLIADNELQCSGRIDIEKLFIGEDE